MDGPGQVPAQLRVVLLVDVIGGDAELVNRIATPGSQDASGLTDDGRLGLVPLHGEHGLADDDVRAVVRQTGIGGLPLTDAAAVPDDGGDPGRRLRVAIDRRVGGGGGGDDLGGGAPQSGGELDDVGSRKPGVGEHVGGQGGAPGAQDAFARAGEDPVTGCGGDGAVGVREGNLGGGLLAHEGEFNLALP